jgi:hypothetical protein
MKLVVPEIMKELEVDDTIYAAVSKIVDHKDLDDGTRLYRVRWQKHSGRYDSWLKEIDFQDLGPIQDYERNLTVMKAKQLKPIDTNVLDKKGKLKECVTLNQFLLPKELDQQVLLSASQKQAWGVKQFMKNAKRVHTKSIIDMDSDSENETGVF